MLSLIAVFAQLSLLPVHNLQSVPAGESVHSTSAQAVDPALQKLAVGEARHGHDAEHDASTCAVCRTLQQVRYSLTQTSASGESVQLAPSALSHSNTLASANHDLTASAPRAPPSAA